MRISGIKTCDTQNGPGLRVSLWTQGCFFKCKGCHNRETWNMAGGKSFEEGDLEYILSEMRKGEQSLSILGGEPLLIRNKYELYHILREAKTEFPDRETWLWTGRSWTNVVQEFRHVLDFLDVIVTGKFEEDKKVDVVETEADIYRGSRNQRVIDVKKSLKAKKIVDYIV